MSLAGNRPGGVGAPEQQRVLSHWANSGTQTHHANPRLPLWLFRALLDGGRSRECVGGFTHSLNCPGLDVGHMPLTHTLLDKAWSRGLTSLKGMLTMCLALSLTIGKGE